ncbi:MAG TPA: TVP38/TMEM64 family protein [Thermoanaerobaculia bacterium]|nr:TVP38/TMEM64 family protein [Thermoanaerobaculia bacterium]
MTDLSAPAETMEPASTGGRARALPLWARVLAGAAVLVALVLVGRQLGGYVPRFAGWVEGQGIWGPVVFVAGYALATVAMVPGSLLTLAAGAIFGLVEGTLYVFAGAVLGSSLAFLVARYLARGAVARRLAGNARFRTIDRAVGRQGRKIVLLLRLSPVFPFNLLNYALGLTDVRFGDYLVGSIGMLPGTLLYVYYGKLAGEVAAVAGGVEAERGAGYWAVLGLGLAATLAVTALVTRTARRALREETADAGS